MTCGTAIPTVKDGGNHTHAFTDAAATAESHEACLRVSKALAGVGMRVLTDEDFVKKVRFNFQIQRWVGNDANDLHAGVGAGKLRGGQEGEVGEEILSTR